jgi:lipoyl(octanoyl) transferase
MSRVLGRTIDPSDLIEPITAGFRRTLGTDTDSLNPVSLDTVRTNA